MITNLGGNNIIVGGVGGDDVTSGAGDDVIAGDQITLERDALGTIQSFLPTDLLSDVISTQSDDNIDAGHGDNIVMGGTGSDTIAADDGTDMIIGDLAAIKWSQGLVSSVIPQLTDSSFADNDIIDAGHGDNTVLGGTGNDLIHSGDGDDILVGDLAYIRWTDGLRTSVIAIFEVQPFDAEDRITSLAGRDQIIGGDGADTISNGSGETVILGDLGVIISDSEGRYLSVDDQFLGRGGDDIIVGGSDRDLIIGSMGDDIVDAGAGSDLILGDHGIITRDTGSLRVFADEIGIGGKDQLESGSGGDIVLGGHGGDLIGGDFGDDLLFGDYQEVMLRLDADNVERLVYLRSPTSEHDILRTTQANLLGDRRDIVITEQAMQLQSDIRILSASAQVRELESAIEVDLTAPINLLAPEGIRLDRTILDRLEQGIVASKQQQTRIEPTVMEPLMPSQAPQSQLPSIAVDAVVPAGDIDSTSTEQTSGMAEEMIGMIAGLSVAKRGLHSRRLGLRSLSAQLQGADKENLTESDRDQRQRH
jgi:Ca2+-binding RTX toxin-like protein